MTTPVIIDIIVAAVLLGFVLFGARRGLFRALAGLLVVIVALVGAGIAAATFAPPAAKLVTPLLSEHIERRVEDAMAQQALETAQGIMPESEAPAETESAFDIGNLLALLGLDGDVRASLTETVQEKVHDTGVSLATAVVESLAQTFLYGLLYILSFALLLLVLNILVRAMDLVLKLPGLHGLNALGGGAIGLAEGALLLFLAVWVLRRMGVSFETEPWTQAHILGIFTENTPLGVLSRFQ